jgi:hypothetical protein
MVLRIFGRWFFSDLGFNGFLGFGCFGVFQDLDLIGSSGWMLDFVDTGFCSVLRIGLFSFADTKMLKLSGV